MVGDISSGGPLSAEEMLARAKAAVESGRTAGKLSAVQKLLAGQDAPEDTVELSPVQKILAAQEKAAAKSESFFDSDDYLRLKVSQLRGQLSLYTTLPGLDPNGAIVGGIEAEIKDIIQKQQDKIAASQAKADETRTQLEEQDRLKAAAAALVSSDAMLAKVKGTAPKAPISKEAQALLDRLSVDKTT